MLGCTNCSYKSNLECAVSHVRPAPGDKELETVLLESGDTVYAFVIPQGSCLNPLRLPRDVSLKPLSGEAKVTSVQVWVDHTCEAVPRSDILHLVRASLEQQIGDQVQVPEGTTVQYASVREAQVGDLCASCHSGTLTERKAVEIGHTFLLGTRYSGIMGYGIVPRSGDQRKAREPLQMGCYGIGVTRVLGVMAQQGMKRFEDLESAQRSAKPSKRRGFVWPKGMAPFEALVLPSSPANLQAAERLCKQLQSGMTVASEGHAPETVLQVPASDVALDDRVDRSLGSRLIDADLLGYPLVFILGRHFEKTGEVELRQAGRQVQYVNGSALTM